jgi:predicted 3-demethylubiquinone-9 3-methyltransferase (glyoxalase superfamily)
MAKKLIPCLWFDKNMKEILNYYISIFPDTKTSNIDSLSDTPSGTVELATMTILGQDFQLMTAGPTFKFNESVSFVVDCEDQKEVDYYWNALTTNGGAESECGWCKDRYGLSWQIVPKQLGILMSDPDKEKANRVTQAMLKMKKLIVADLQSAYDGE